MSSITIISDAPNCGITYDRHYDNHNTGHWSVSGGEKSFIRLTPRHGTDDDAGLGNDDEGRHEGQEGPEQEDEAQLAATGSEINDTNNRTAREH